MRMPLTEFMTNGDLKFIVVFAAFGVTASYHFIKKIGLKNNPNAKELIAYHNSKIDSASFWILISGILSLLLGLMHSFYFVGKAGGIAPNLMFQGMSYTLITPVMGVGLYIICKILKGILNTSKEKQ